MSSKPVWIWLPGHSQPVQAGTFTLQERATQPVGAFSYAPDYLERPDKTALDQRQLARFRGTAKATAYGGLFDIFQDVKPEGFGLDMLYRQQQRTSLAALEALELSPGDAVGALEVCDDIQAKIDFVPHSAPAMFEVMEALAPSQASTHVATTLANLPGTSLGGERPKITVLHEGQLWIAKFAGKADDPSAPLREYLAMRLAALCGIDAAPVQYTHRNGRGTVLVQRFDRHIDTQGQLLRTHFASGATVLGAQAALRDAPGRSYAALAMNAAAWGVQGHKAELWRRMAFNVLVGNGDDHPRNHGFVLGPQGWALSPAFDIAPYTPHGGKVQAVHGLSMGVLRNGDAAATADNLLLASKDLGVDYDQANDYLDQSFATLHSRWDALAHEVGQPPLAAPLFVLPPRAERISAQAVAKFRPSARR